MFLSLVFSLTALAFFAVFFTAIAYGVAMKIFKLCRIRERKRRTK